MRCWPITGPKLIWQDPDLLIRTLEHYKAPMLTQWPLRGHPVAMHSTQIIEVKRHYLAAVSFGS